MGVKIGCHFVSIVMESCLIGFRRVIGLIITLPTQEHLITLNLLLGLPGFITKHDSIIDFITRLNLLM